ncbi:ABC transporter substrate-binding protein [Actinosynnema sp. ALI-1.44]|uniref:ABC transporter substrate-binding protein n=1 Tax=Actinosynnema sp. ALI-1.44 TaxID=1933779 RepID=UPI00143CD694|nr:ABC transporter substrate-binding protein [Actinosynnema sp. ALI-1.44]
MEKKRIRLGVLPVLGAAPVFLAAERGYFAAEGLEVEFVTIQGAGAAIPTMARGELDLVFGNYVSFFTAEAKRTAAIRFVADGYYANPRTWMVLVAKDSPLRKPADLSGKRVAVTTANSLADLTIKSVLGTSGANVTVPSFVEMPYTQMGEALRSRRVDAALLSEPYITDVSKRYGALPLFDAAAGPTAEIPISGYATTEKFAADNPNTIAAFQRALSRGAAVAVTDRTAVEQSIRGYAGVDEQTAALVTLVGYPTSLDPTRLQRVPDLMLSYGGLSQRLDARSMILPSARLTP